MPTTTWDVRNGMGQVVTDLAGLADTLHTSVEDAAAHLLGDEAMSKAAPVRLLNEAKAKFKPGGDVPPEIANGSFVSWSGGKGRVDLIVSNGKVPGVEGDVEGTSKSPAARVVVWENGKATGKKIGASTHTLKRIPPIKADEKKSTDPAAVLVSMLADHEEIVEALNLPTFAAVSGRAVKAVFDRGVAAWPGEDVTALDAKGWALGRVDYFLKVATGENTGAAGNDADLLADGHPSKAEPPPGFERVAPPPAATGEVPAQDGVVVISREDIDDEVKALLAEI